MASSEFKEIDYFEKSQIMLEIFTEDSLVWCKQYAERFTLLKVLFNALNNVIKDEKKVICEFEKCLNRDYKINVNERIESFDESQEKFPYDILSYIDLRTEFIPCLRILIFLCRQKNISVENILTQFKNNTS